MKPVGWAVVGTSPFVQRRMLHAIRASALAEVRALVTRTPEDHQDLAKQCGATLVTAELSEAANDPRVEAVYIATPVHLHADHVRTCLAARKAVLCEKPLALNLAEAEALRRDVLAGGVLFMEGFMLRFHGAHRAAKAILSEGQLGTVTDATFEFGFWYPPDGTWRQRWDLGGGGGLMDVGSHAVNLVAMLVGRVRSVQALVSTQVHDYEVDDGATLLLHVEPDVHVVVRAAFNARPSRSHWRISGTRGSLTARGTLGQGPDGVMEIARVSPDTPEAPGTPEEIEYEAVNAYQSMLEAFCNELRAPSGGCENDIHESVQVMRVLDAAYQSSRTGRRIDL